MRRQELFNNAFASLGHNKLRTFLTILGIVIGISSVITLLNLGQGAQKTIETSFSSFGPNQVSIMAGQFNMNNPTTMLTSPSYFTLDEVDQLIQREKLYVTGIATQSSQILKVQQDNYTFTGSVYGIYGDYWEVRSTPIERGRQINKTDQDTLAKVVILGPDAVKNLFDTNDNPIGKKIKINGQNYTVVGITKAKGSSGFMNPDEYIYIPLTTMRQFITGATNIIQISAAAKDPETILYAQDELETILRQIRQLKPGVESDFIIRNSVDALSFINQITSIFTVFLAAIAAISLLVGGIGIMNIMFVTVSERTKEIGLRKSLGATKNDILLQFLTEAVAVTSLGGIVGTLLGITISYIFASIAGIVFEIYLNSIFLSVGVSIAIGLVFGIYPAARASRLSPIDALRYE